MIDKVQKIREEVQRLMNELIQEKERGYGSDIDDACILELQNVLTFIDSLKEEPASEDLKKFAEEWDESLYRSDAVIAGANWQKNLNKKDFELLKEWFEDISEKCEHLTSGNVSHNGKMIRGYARNCAEYIKTDLL